MPQQRLFYEYVSESLIPYWYVLTFEPCEINWSQSCLFFDVIKPFGYIERNKYDDSLISMSIYNSDLLINNLSTGKLGLNLNAIKQRLAIHNLDLYLFQQFVIQVSDIQEVLSLMPKER